jgi:molybdopterin molybdotransferase
MSCCDEKNHALTAFPDALDAALDSVDRLGTESIPYEEALGRILREPIRADRDLPACTRSRMDGYALRAGDLEAGVPLPVVGEIRAGDPASIDVPPRTCVKIATGAPLPEALDTVIEHERSDRGDPVTFTLEEVQPGRSLHFGGADARAGAVLVDEGIRLRAHHLGIAATVGATMLTVSRLPRVIVISSGDELVSANETPLPHQVREGNAPMIRSTLQALGTGALQRAHLPDERDVTHDALEQALGAHDLVVTIGGISEGEHDFIRPELESLGIRWDIARANVKPGRPVHVGRAPSGAIACCLPGNPVSALVCAHLFVRPMLAKLAGRTDDPTWSTHALAGDVRPDSIRWCYRPACLEPDGCVRVPRWQGSGDLAHLAGCGGMLELPPAGSPHPEGTMFRFLDWRDA